MACCGAPITAESSAIDAQIKADERSGKAALKVLVLGTSASGKSTVAKQMKILHCEGFSSDELVNYKQILILNIFNGMKELVFQAEQFGIKILRKNKKVATHFANANPYTETLNSDTVELAKQLWADKGTLLIPLYTFRLSDADFFVIGGGNDAIAPRAFFAPVRLWSFLPGPLLRSLYWDLHTPFHSLLTLSHFRYLGIQRMWERRNEIDFPTNLEYMMEHIDRFAQEDFTPTNTDVLYARQRTTGVVETQFSVRFHFRLFVSAGPLRRLLAPITLHSCDTDPFCIPTPQYARFNWSLIDVGGQRSERRKWIHFFEKYVPPSATSR